MSESAVEAAAHSYRNRGWNVIPLEHGGKKPLLPWKPYQSQRSAEREHREWFRSGNNNIGIVTGEISNLCVLDGDSEKAVARIRELGIPDCPEVRTGRGYHFYFEFHEGLRNFQASPSLPGVDFRGEGGYVVAPPSIHATGALYSWEGGHHANQLQLPRLPSWVADQFADQGRTSAVDWRTVVTSAVGKGNRNNSIARLTGHLLRRGVDKEVALELVLGWNRYRLNPPLAEREVIAVVESIARNAGRGRRGVKP